jgi:hypothetical protein
MVEEEEVMVEDEEVMVEEERGLHPMPASQPHMGTGFLRHCEPSGHVPLLVVVALIHTDGREPSM